MLLLLVEIDPADAKFSKDWMWTAACLAGNNQGHVA